MSGTANPPAGWYPAPHAGGQPRYWDGARWLEGAPPPAPPVLTSAPAAAPGVPAHPVATVPGAPPRKKHTVLIITLSVVAVVVVLIAAGIFAFSVFLGSIAEPIYAAHVSRVETSGSQATAYVVVENTGDGSGTPDCSVALYGANGAIVGTTDVTAPAALPAGAARTLRATMTVSGPAVASESTVFCS